MPDSSEIDYERCEYCETDVVSRYRRRHMLVNHPAELKVEDSRKEFAYLQTFVATPAQISLFSELAKHPCLWSTGTDNATRHSTYVEMEKRLEIPKRQCKSRVNYTLAAYRRHLEEKEEMDPNVRALIKFLEDPVPPEFGENIFNELLKKRPQAAAGSSKTSIPLVTPARVVVETVRRRAARTPKVDKIEPSIDEEQPPKRSPYNTRQKRTPTIVMREKTPPVEVNPIEDDALAVLLENFEFCNYPTAEDIDSIALRSDLSIKQVKEWFVSQRRKKSASEPPKRGRHKRIAEQPPTELDVQYKNRRLPLPLLNILERKFAENMFPTSAEMERIALTLGFSMQRISCWYANRRTRYYRDLAGNEKGDVPPFTEAQRCMLAEEFERNSHPNKPERSRIADELRVPETQVESWFAQRRRLMRRSASSSLQESDDEGDNSEHDDTVTTSTERDAAKPKRRSNLAKRSRPPTKPSADDEKLKEDENEEDSNKVIDDIIKRYRRKRRPRHIRFASPEVSEVSIIELDEDDAEKDESESGEAQTTTTSLVGNPAHNEEDREKDAAKDDGNQEGAADEDDDDPFSVGSVNSDDLLFGGGIEDKENQLFLDEMDNDIWARAPPAKRERHASA